MWWTSDGYFVNLARLSVFDFLQFCSSPYRIMEAFCNDSLHVSLPVYSIADPKPVPQLEQLENSCRLNLFQTTLKQLGQNRSEPLCLSPVVCHRGQSILLCFIN